MPAVSACDEVFSVALGRGDGAVFDREDRVLHAVDDERTCPQARCGSCGGARYEETVTFYRDAIGLPVLETFHDSYGLDGTILGLPGGRVHLEIVRAGQASYPGGGLDQLVFYLPDPAAREQMEVRLAAAGARPVPQIDYWQANGGVTYQDPDGREVVFASWIYIPPGS